MSAVLGSTPCAAPVLLSVEAIIGAGKSTLLEELDSNSDILVVREPVDLWQKQRGNETLLNRYYGDQKTNAFMFETYAMMSRVQALRRVSSQVRPETRAIVMERSWLSSRYCFARNSQDLGHLDELQASLHEDLFNWGLETWPKLDGVVFIDLPVDVAQNRVAKRGRTAESAIPVNYQKELIAKHRQWLHGNSDVRFAGPVLTLDGSGDKQDGAVRVMAKRVEDFIEQLQAVKKDKPSTHVSKSGCHSCEKENFTPRVMNNVQQQGDTDVSMSTMRENGAAYLTPIKSHTNMIGASRQTPVKRAKSEPHA
jgi:deoxyadenosine/deoxycytidine kinase